MNFDSVMCDWLTISHRFHTEDEPGMVVNGGKIMRIDADGVIDWEQVCWENLRCPTSDTSLRIRCDGVKMQMTGNIGRWMQEDNLQGLTVMQCVDLWAKFLSSRGILPPLFGTRPAVGDSGTFITRVDLAANMWTDNFSALTQTAMSQRIGQKPARAGKYGAMWGYEAKRGNWVKAKLYDKTCELEGRRTPASGATVARFEVQLGGEKLKRLGLDSVNKWKEENDMENVTYKEFADQVFRQQTMAESWSDIPIRVRQYAVLWRDGVDIRGQFKSPSGFYKVRTKLLEHGLDIAQPCNIVSLTRRIVEVRVMPLQSRRVA